MSNKRRYSWDELQEVTQRHGIVIDPPKPREDPWKSDLGRAIKAEQRRKAKASTRVTPMNPPSTKVYYVRSAGAEVFDVRSGEWIARDERWWGQQQRYGPEFAKVIECYDTTGPTVVQHQTYGRVITRGCMTCGVAELARPTSPMRFGKWRGSMCPTHHANWESLTTSGRKQLGLFVARCLYDAGRLPDDYPTLDGPLAGSHPIQQYPANWSRFTWGGRVLRSKSPEKQQPLTSPFGFLNPGPIPLAEGAKG